MFLVSRYGFKTCLVTGLVLVFVVLHYGQTKNNQGSCPTPSAALGEPLYYWDLTLRSSVNLSLYGWFTSTPCPQLLHSSGCKWQSLFIKDWVELTFHVYLLCFHLSTYGQHLDFVSRLLWIILNVKIRVSQKTWIHYQEQSKHEPMTGNVLSLWLNF